MTLRWQDVDKILGEALERPLSERAAYLDEACAGDDQLRRQVAALLKAHENCDGFLDQNALDVAARATAQALADQAQFRVGQQLGVYELLALIGAGGMGEVYRARDSRLSRDVAVKVLPEAFTLDPDRLARFKREAQVLAALNHPNIAAIYGFEESGGVQALVLELVGGTTLAERIAQGPIPFLETLPIARQIAEALEATHEQGIVHRDLKPSNIKIRADGTIKVLDFGLARMAAGRRDAVSDVGRTAVPKSVGATSVVLDLISGTPAYMSPEQARGKPVDRRTDIWAFGCLLYEMLTGRQAFDGNDAADILAAVIGREPDWTVLPNDVPAPCRAYLRRCLHKDPKERVQDMGDLRLVLEGAFDVPPAQSDIRVTTDDVRSVRRRSLILASLAVLVAALVSGSATWLLKPAPAGPVQEIRRFPVVPTPRSPLAIAVNNRDLALTVDGTRLVYFAGEGADRQLYVRTFDEIDAVPIREGPRLFEPFVSPDSRWVGFIDESDFALKKVPILGGPSVPIASVGTEIMGASWGSNETIVFARNDGTGLWTVPAAGGEPKAITTPNTDREEVSHRWPEFLPGGRDVLFTIVSGQHAERFQIAVVNLETLEQKILVPRGSNPRFSGTGHIVFVVEDTLHAVPFDRVRLEVRGDPVPVLSGVVSKASGAADFSLSRDGSLAYVQPSDQTVARTLVWVDREGQEEPINAPARAYVYPRLSPDGTRVALDVRDQENDVWIWDLIRKTFMRLTFESTMDRVPVWTPDGRVLFSSNSRGAANLFLQAVDGPSAAEQLTHSSNDHFPTSISPDGAFAVFSDNTTYDLMMLPLNGDHQVQPLVRTRFVEENGEISPDGRWVAYQSNQSGQHEIYVRPFPDVARGYFQISAGGGTRPLWARSGRELFYVAATGALMGVPIRPGTTWTAGTPRKLLEGGQYYFGSGRINHRTYDVAPDGRRFLLIKSVGDSEQSATAASMVVVLNWTRELQRLVPAQ
jgi:serine/threonine-protein kinase